MPPSCALDITSCRREGSFRASWLDQILPHGLAPDPVFQPVAEEPLIDIQVGCSLAGVPGFDAVGLYGIVPDVFRFSVAFAVGTSFSQDVLRAGFCIFGGCTTAPSSSEDANASESGVDRRIPGFDFSKSRDAEGCWELKLPNAGMPALGATVALLEVVLIAIEMKGQ